MRTIFLIVILVVLRLGGYESKEYSSEDMIRFQNQTVSRLLRMMQLYYNAGDLRIRRLNTKRAYYENSQEFEEGYIMGEIIERYRRLVEHTKLAEKIKSYSPFDVMNRLELGQRLYFEVFHLVNMIHEVPRKYGHYDADEPEVAMEPVKTYSHHEIKEGDDFETRERKRLKLAKKRAKELKKHRLEYLKKGKLTTATVKRRPSHHTKNKWGWPLEYGWEIDYW